MIAEGEVVDTTRMSGSEARRLVDAAIAERAGDFDCVVGQPDVAISEMWVDVGEPIGAQLL